MGKVIKRTIQISGLAVSLPRLIPALVLFGVLAVSQASATTYTFIVPTGTQPSPNPNTILGALSAAISSDPSGLDPGLFAFYDFYIRPDIADDSTSDLSNHGLSNHGLSNHGLSNHPSPFNLITDYSMSASTAISPVPGCTPSPCTPTYDAMPIAEPFPWLGAAANFTFNGQSTVPAGASTETKPPAAAFAFGLDTSAYSAVQTPQITFQVFPLAARH